MELAWLDDFIALDRTRNFTAAAAARHATQPAFSRRIQNLEQWLGAALFNREARPVTLTRAGEDFKPRAYRLRDDIMDTRRIITLSATSLPDAKIIYTTNSIAIGLLPHWIQTQNIVNYRVVVSSVSACIEASRQGRCDYVLIPHFPSLENERPKDATLVAQDTMIFLIPDNMPVPAAIDENGRIHGATLMYSPNTAYGRVIGQYMNQHGLSLASPPVCESASAEALLSLVKGGMGAGWVVHSLVSDQNTPAYHHTPFDIAFDIILLQSSVK